MRRMLWAVGAALVLGALFVAGRSWSDTEPKPAKPRSRVAVFNLTATLKGYSKYKASREELTKALAKYQGKDTELKKRSDSLAEERKQGGTTAGRREEIDEELKQLQRKIEDNKAAAQKVIVSKQEEQLKALYADVQAAARKYAREHDLELVLHYNDAAAPEQIDSPANIARKLQAGGLTPIHAAAGVDITAAITAALNKSVKKGD